MMRTVAVTHGRDGYTVRILEAPIWRLAVEEIYGEIDTALGHQLCGNNSWSWKVALPWPKDEYGPKIALGVLMYRVSNYLLTISSKKEKLIQEIPISVADGDKAFDDLVSVEEGGWHAYSGE